MSKDENIEIKRILEILKSKIIWILFIVLCTITVGYVYSYYFVVPKYKASSTLLLVPNGATDSHMVTVTDLTLNSGLVTTYSNIAKQTIVLSEVIQNLNLDITESELLKYLTINTKKDTYIIEIQVENEDPQFALDATREISNVFLTKIKEIYNLENVGIVDEANLLNGPSNINHLKDMGISALIGLFISGIVIAIIYIIDNTIKTEEDIEKYVGIKSIGLVPINLNKSQEIIDRDASKSFVTECINTIRTNILYMTSMEETAKTILITSCMPQEGKSFISANIAASFAETNKKVLLIDADMRKGRANKIFSIETEQGLSDYIYSIGEDNKKDLELAKEFIKETEIPNLHILTKGTIPPNPSELLDSESMKKLINLLKFAYDIIIIDAPPCKLVTDSVILSTIVDSTVLVVNSHITPIADVIDVKKSIDSVDGKIMGAILNKVKISKNTYSRNYYYGNSKNEDKIDIKQKEIIEVSKVIDEALIKLDERLNDNLKAEEFENYIDSQEIQNQNINFEKYYEKQLELIEKNLYNKIEKSLRLNLNIVKNDIENVVKEKIMTTDDIRKIIENSTLNKEEVKSIIENNTLNKEDIKNIIINNTLDREKVQKIVQDSSLNEEQIKSIIEEQVNKIDLSEQVEQISKVLLNLERNYIDLSNKFDDEYNKRKQEKANNIVEFKLLKKQKKASKREFNLDEDIPFEVLEELSIYQIPYTEEEYGKIIKFN